MRISRLHLKIFGTFLVTLVAAELLVFAIYRVGFQPDRFSRFSGLAANHAMLLREALKRRSRTNRNAFSETDLGRGEGQLEAFLRDLAVAYGGRVWLVSEGRTIADSGTGPLPAFPERRARHFDTYSIAWGLGGRLFVRLPISDAGLGRAQLFYRADRNQDGSGDFLLVLLGLALAFVILSVPVSRLITRRLADLRDSALRFAAGTLTERAPEYGKDEIGELARTFNIMASRIERMIAAQKELSAHVSHELRSPLARMRLSEEMLRSELASTGRDDAHRLDSIRTEIELVDRLVGRILQFAAMDSRPGLQGSADAGTILNETIGEFAGLFDHSGLVTTLEWRHAVVSEFPSFVARGSGDLLRTIFRAALENCMHHGSPAGRVLIGVRPEGESWIVSVRNPTRDESVAVSEVFEPFRKSSLETEGHGLGLAILQKAANLCGGTCVAKMESGTFTLEITLPRLSDSLA